LVSRAWGLRLRDSVWGAHTHTNSLKFVVKCNVVRLLVTLDPALPHLSKCMNQTPTKHIRRVRLLVAPLSFQKEKERGRREGEREAEREVGRERETERERATEKGRKREKRERE